MRKLVLGICAGFAALLAVTLTIVVKTYEGAVEEDYYRKSLSWFEDRRATEAGVPAGPPAASRDGGEVRFRVDPTPVRAMRDLVFTVEIPGEPPRAAPWIDLSMRGMTMPPNRVDLSPDGTGRYRGKGVVVRCPSGGKSWTATVHVPGRGDSAFPFDVAD